MITFKELKKILSVNNYTLKVNTGCDYECINSLELFRDNALYNAFNNCIVESVDIYDDPADNEIILHMLYFDDETGLYFDTVTGEKLPERLQKEVKNNG